MNNQLAWLSVKSRLHCSFLCFIENIITTKTPVILYNKLEFFSDRHNNSTRQSSESCFLLPTCRTRAKQRTVCYRAMVVWNSLPRFLISGSSTASFRKRLKLCLFAQEIVQSGMILIRLRFPLFLRDVFFFKSFTFMCNHKIAICR